MNQKQIIRLFYVLTALGMSLFFVTHPKTDRVSYRNVAPVWDTSNMAIPGIVSQM